MRPADRQTLPSSCPLDCPDACKLDITVEAGKVISVAGSDQDPLTAGFICSKVRNLPRHLYGEHRLSQPMVRCGAKGTASFAPIGWDQALDLAARKLRETRDRFGGEAILPLAYGGSNGHLSQDSTDARLFRRLGSSQLLRSICAAAAGRAARGLYGAVPSTAYEDYEHANLIIVWGANPSVTSIHLLPIIERALSRGARLVVVDPRRIPLAKKADLHLQLRPGSDLPLALAMIRELFESSQADTEFLARYTTGSAELARRASSWTIDRAAETCGLQADDIRQLVELYAAAEPAVIRCGWGVERNRNGGSATAAVLALPAVAGKLGRRGGGFTMSNTPAWKLDHEPAINALQPPTRTINMNRLGRALESADPAIHLLFVYNCNPVATFPEQRRVRRGLEREDLFTVVFDQTMTDSARYADLVLPATCFPEHQELRNGYGSWALHDSPPVAEPYGEARSNFVVFAELCRRLDLDQADDLTSEEAFAAALLQQLPEAQREHLSTGTRPYSGNAPLLMRDFLPATDDGKVHLLPEELDREAPDGLYSYRPAEHSHGSGRSLALISPATRQRVSSTFGQLDRKPAAVELHPDDAASRGLASGDPVRVWNEIGEVHCQLRINDDQRRGVALLPKGLWTHQTDNGATGNALVADQLTDLAGGACFNDVRVEIEKR